MLRVTTRVATMFVQRSALYITYQAAESLIRTLYVLGKQLSFR